MSLINDYCLKMFVSKDEFRPSIQYVAIHNNCLYATNSYIGAKISAELCANEYHNDEENLFPAEEFDQIISNHDYYPTTEMKTIDFLDYMMNCEKIKIGKEKTVKFINKRYAYKYLKIILNVILMTGTDKIEISESVGLNELTKIIAGDFTMIIMPKRYDHDID